MRGRNYDQEYCPRSEDEPQPDHAFAGFFEVEYLHELEVDTLEHQGGEEQALQEECHLPVLCDEFEHDVVLPSALCASGR